MYINDRDQINYHGFLKALREMQGASLKQVAEGICSDSEVSRVEIGDRLPEKLMRDRITSRLGVSGEEYEEYLRPEEYRQWEIRMFILEHLNKGDAEAVQKGIDVFDEIPDKNPVQEQFADTMRFMLAHMKGASEETLCAYAELAVAHTVPDVDAAFQGVQLLADQELNLIAEYTRLREYYGNPEEEFAWRLSEYKRILTYVDKSYMDTIGQSKIYPKTTYFVCKWILGHESNIEYLERALELCNKSIELLRDASRLYYFVELLECRKEIIEHLLKEIDDTNRIEELKALRVKDAEWESLFKELYTEYDVPVYMQNFTYLYVETECNSVVEVIRTRRNMLKLSRVKVSDNICDEKTVERFENYTHSPSIVVVRDIFDRIGLCAEYKRARVITDNAEMLYTYKKLISCINNFKNEEAEIHIRELEEKLHMNISYNKQELKRVENLIAVRNRKLDAEEFYKSTMEALECTLPVWAILKNKNNFGLYLTRAELTCIFDLAFKTNSDLKYRCLEIIGDKCKDDIDKEQSAARIAVYEFLIGGLASYLGDEGLFNESTSLSEKLLRECLLQRRLAVLADNLYNIVWNYQEIEKNANRTVDLDKVKRMLKRSILLSDLNKDFNWSAFFQDKLTNLNN